LKVTDEKAGSGSQNKVYESKDPDPYLNFTDPEHCREPNISHKDVHISYKKFKSETTSNPDLAFYQYADPMSKNQCGSAWTQILI
jgi:hypothetical protein